MASSKKQDSKVSAQPNGVASSSENNSFKADLPQILAAIGAALSDTCVGMALAFSAVLIPQLLQEQIDSPNSIEISKQESTYIASLQILIVLPSSVINGFLMDAFGRTTVLKIGAIPTIAGWILVATSYNKWMVIIGRTLCGIIAGMFTTSAIVYITEISTPKYRGALVVLEPVGVSLGMLMVYVIGACLHWRTFAWFSVGYTLVPLAVSMFLPESPPWLVSKNRIEDAKKSLHWLKKYHSQPKREHKKRRVDEGEMVGIKVTSSKVNAQMNKEERVLEDFKNALKNCRRVEKELATLIDDHSIKEKQVTQQKNWRMFLEPTVYKPLFIISGLCIIQQLAGSYIMLLYSVTFMENVGTKVNPYLASTFIGGMRFVMSVATVWLLRFYKRRNLLFIGLGGMAVCMGVSGLYTSWILEGKTAHNWVPVVMLPLYVLFAMVSVLSIPFAFTGEMFPLAARGSAQSICFVVMHLFMFIVLESYFSLSSFFGGASGIQYFFGVVAFIGLVYCYVFVPETHRKKFSEIEDYFTEHSTYLSVKPKNNQRLPECNELIQIVTPNKPAL